LCRGRLASGVSGRRGKKHALMLVIIVSMYVGGGSDLLEMTPDEPNHNISGGPNEEFTPPLIGYRKYGKSYTEGGENENERERGWGPNKGCVSRPVFICIHISLREGKLIGKRESEKEEMRE